MAGKLDGAVVSVRDNGDLVTDITSSQLVDVPRDERVTIRCDGHLTAGIYPPDHGQPDLTLLAVLGHEECLEICLVGESASKFLGIHSGSQVTLSW